MLFYLLSFTFSICIFLQIYGNTYSSTLNLITLLNILLLSYLYIKNSIFGNDLVTLRSIIKQSDNTTFEDIFNPSKRKHFRVFNTRSRSFFPFELEHEK